jgi:tripartite-type tricarboxylate transporter receptor subunit TctC
MKLSRLKNVVIGALAAVSLIALSQTVLAEYPEKPITLVAPYGAGGASDLAARTLSAAVPTYLGQPVIVVNRTGAGGVTGSTYVYKARPDGYTLLLGRVGCNGLVPALNETIPYDWDSFTFLGMLELNPFVFVVNADSPYQTLGDLMDALRANPGTLTYSHSGPQGLLAMGSQLLLDQAGLDPSAATGIPYKGGGEAKTALLGGHVDFLGINLAPVLDQIKAGKLRALAVTTPEIYVAIPDVPTVAESGYPGLETAIGWSVLLGPPDLPEEIVATWQEALQGVAKDKTWLKLTQSLGSIPYVTSPQETEQYIENQYVTYKKLGERLGLIIK